MRFPSKPPLKRKPVGYIGTRHQTIGSDILAVLDALTMPRAMLGDVLVDELESVVATEWYDIDKLLTVLDALQSRVGEVGLRKIGRALFRRTHQEAVLRTAKSAKDVVTGIDGMYKSANRGRDIGGWSVLSYEIGYAQLEKTTPHHCALEEGILDAALTAVRALSSISQSRCFRSGADRCVFEIRTSNRNIGWM